MRTDEERRAVYGRRLARERGARGLSQREVAAGLEVDQKVVVRAEKGQASEETFAALERFYGMGDPYPAAPRDPVRRAEWFAARNVAIARGVPVPASGTFGKGEPPRAA